MRPLLLDLFCGAGGASEGYARAGFEIVGVDIAPQPHYPFEFHQADALEFELGVQQDGIWDYGWDAIHASPPCQAYIRSGNTARDGRHPRLIGPVRKRLETTGLPYVIENVPGAEMRPDIVLCGSMFGLQVRRHRWFETNVALPPWTMACNHSLPITGVYGHPHGGNGAAKGVLPGDRGTWSRAMGIDWMTAAELADAIPPAYTEFIGVRLLEHLRASA